MQIENNGQIDPSLPCRDVGNVAGPNPIRLPDLKISADKVNTLMAGPIRSGRNLEASYCFRPDIMLSHQPGNTLFATAHAFIGQSIVDPWGPIDASMKLVDGRNTIQ